MSVLLPYKKRSEGKDIHQFPNNESMGKFSKAQAQPHLRSEGGSGRILNSFEILMVDLVIYRNEEDPIENEGA